MDCFCCSKHRTNRSTKEDTKFSEGMLVSEHWTTVHRQTNILFSGVAFCVEQCSDSRELCIDLLMSNFTMTIIWNMTGVFLMIKTKMMTSIAAKSSTKTCRNSLTKHHIQTRTVTVVGPSVLNSFACTRYTCGRLVLLCVHILL